MTSASSSPARTLLAGASGYIGRHVGRELLRRGHAVVAPLRARCGVGGRGTAAALSQQLPGADLRVADVCDARSLEQACPADEPLDAVVSCLASRGGAPADAWRVDHQANLNLLELARARGARHFVLLSAICVQKPRLEFQRAKLAFEEALIDSGLDYSIVRPTAYFKSLAGQVERVRRGRPFLVFGDGTLTACKPIAEVDLARYLADCLGDPGRRNRILPIGGPGPAITPRGQADLLAELTGRPLRVKRVPIGLFDAIIGVLDASARLWPRLRDRAEFARIGRYYATESMLVWDTTRGRYDADATPEFGSETLREFYRRVLDEGLAGQELGDHAMFD